MGVFFCRHQTAEWDFPLQSRLKRRVGLDFGGEIGRVVDEILRDGIDLNALGCDLGAELKYA